MKKTSILHLVTTAKNASPFDVNMAFDGGYDNIMPYTNVELDEVEALTQDAMFSRSPSGVKAEALFFGGRDVHVALKMQQKAKSTMFPPFEMSTFADPSGAFTTAAAMVAKTEAHLQANQQALSQQTVAIFGATGTVGTTAALIAANAGAKVYMVAHRELKAMEAYAERLKTQYQVDLSVIAGNDDATKTQVLNTVSVALCAASAGRRVLDAKHYAETNTLKIVADVNAVPPSGIEGVDAQMLGTTIENTDIVGFGALAVGQLKYVTQHKLLQSMLESDTPLHIDYQQAYECACANAE